MSDTPEVMPFQTASEAARQLNDSEKTVRSAQAARKARGEAYAEAKALYKRELRVARLKHLDAPSDRVRDDQAHEENLADDVLREVCEVVDRAGLHRSDFTTVGSLELLMDLCKEARDGAKDAVQVWERWGSQWQSVVGWCRDDASREMGGGRKPLRAVEGGR